MSWKIVRAIRGGEQDHENAAPADGSSCVGVSKGDVERWIDTKKLPDGVSKSRVVNQVKDPCDTGRVAGLAAYFDDDLLSDAVTLSE